MVDNSSSLYSFGELLKKFRTRQRLTQQQLADRIGMHRNGIGRWEQGSFLPTNKAMVLELARQLHLDDHEARQFLEASLLSLPPHWFLPFQANLLFTGRHEILEMIHQHLHTEQVVPYIRSCALQGIGGIGKTQIAIEYAYRYMLEYSAVFWIEAETTESVVASMIRIADTLQLVEQQEADQRHILAAVQRWLATHGKWLLIWDNLEELDLLRRFLPSARQGNNLITTRCQALGTLAQGIEILPMKQKEGVLFVLRRAKLLHLDAADSAVQRFAQHHPQEYAAAEKLVEVMGGLPLALDQAGAYIEETNCGLSGYLHRYEQQRQQLLDRRGGGSEDHPHSVVATLLLACQRVEQEDPVAMELLRFCAFLHPDAIPEEFLEAGAPYLGNVLQPVAADPCRLDQAIIVLRAFSLVQRHPETRTLSIHRLVLVIVQERMCETERACWQQRAARACNALFPVSKLETWKQCERLLPHVMACVTAIPDQRAGRELAAVLHKAASYMNDRCLFQQTEPLHQRVIRIQEHLFGPLHLDVAKSLMALGNLYHEQGKYEQGVKVYRRALHIREENLGPEHPLVAGTLTGLARIYGEQGRYEEAITMCQRALHIREECFGSEHDHTIHSLFELGNLYHDHGEYERAEALYQRTLCFREKMLGSEHPFVAFPLQELAAIYVRQEKLEQAETLYRRALRLWEEGIEPGYLQCIYPLKGLADISYSQGRYEEAELLYQQALSILTEKISENHPDAARILVGLSRLYEHQQKIEQAEAHLLHACAIFEHQLGQTHPDTIQARREYCRLSGQSKRFAKTVKAEQQEDTRHRQKQTTQNTICPMGEMKITPQETSPLKGFLSACCELHPRAWSRASDLWQTYMQWSIDHQERFPLSRRDFTAQLKALGCRNDRTKTARIWRGIAIMPQERVTLDDER